MADEISSRQRYIVALGHEEADSGEIYEMAERCRIN